MDDRLQSLAAAKGLDWTKVLEGVKRLLPILGTIAKLTPNPYDDMAVAFLKALLEESQASSG